MTKGAKKILVSIFLTSFFAPFAYANTCYTAVDFGATLANGLYEETGVNSFGLPIWSNGVYAVGHICYDELGFWDLEPAGIFPQCSSSAYYYINATADSPDDNAWSYDSGTAPAGSFSLAECPAGEGGGGMEIDDSNATSSIEQTQTNISQALWFASASMVFILWLFKPRHE